MDSSTDARRSRKVPVKDTSSDSGAIIDEIYGDKSGEPEESLKEIRQSPRRPSVKVLLIAVGVLAVLVVFSAVGFLTFNRKKHFDEKHVVLNVEFLNEVPSGGEATLTYRVTNDEPVAIRNVELSVSAPEGWTFKRSEPSPSDANSTLWRMGTLPARASRAVAVTGVIVGEVGSVKTFNISVTYRPANFNYDFTAKRSASVSIGSSILELDLNGPSEASPGTKVTYTLTYTNASKDTLSGVRISGSFPASFESTSFDPEPREERRTWIIDELKSGGTGTIAIEGTFSGSVGESVEFTFLAELRRGSVLERQVEVSVVVLLVESRLSLELSVNRKTSESVAAPGEKLSYELAYRNESDLELRSVSLSVALSGDAFDAKSFSDDYGTKLKEGSATWDPSTVPELASIKPQGSGKVRFNAKVLESPSITKGEPGPTVVARGSAKVESTPDGAGGDEGKVLAVTSTPLITKVTSKATLSVDPRYYGDQGEVFGLGPLPPTVGRTTVYRVSWFLGNTTNDLKDLTVVASVPTSVFWTGRNVATTAGDLTFDAQSRTVTWSLNRLPARVGQEQPTLEAHFELSVTPSSSDVGLMPTLLEASKLTATDTFANSRVDVQRDRVTTDLPNDPQAAGRGAVVSGA